MTLTRRDALARVMDGAETAGLLAETADTADERTVADLFRSYGARLTRKTQPPPPRAVAKPGAGVRGTPLRGIQGGVPVPVGPIPPGPAAARPVPAGDDILAGDEPLVRAMAPVTRGPAGGRR